MIVCDIVGIAGKAPLVRAGQVKGGRSHECPVRTFPDVSESSAGDCPVADARLKKGPNKPSSRHCFVAFVPAPRRRTDGACGSFGPRIGSYDTGQECRGQECRTRQLAENCRVSFVKAEGCISQQMEEHHDAQDSDWSSRRGDRHSRLDIECVGLSRRRWLRSRLWWAALCRRRLRQGRLCWPRPLRTPSLRVPRP